MSQKALELLQARFPEAVLESGTTFGDDWAKVKREAILEIATWLKADPALDMQMLVDLTAVDYLDYDPRHRLALEDPARYEVVYHFHSIRQRQRLRLKIRVGGSDMVVPSITSVYKAADWWERGVWDFYGVRFSGHPNLKRMWTYEEFKGHPLRKDYPIHLRQPLTPERHVTDLVRGPGPGPSHKHTPFSQRPGARPNTKSDAYD